MRLPFQPQPKSLTDRAQAVADDAIGFARSIPSRLEGGRERALAVAGAAAGVAAGLVFWRSRSDHEKSVHDDPAKPPTPWKTAPPQAAEKPVTDSREAAANAAGARSK
jgi:hypothetical protein